MAGVHSGIGHEAIHVGAFYGLHHDDFVQPHFRARAAWLMRGLSPKILMADVFGKRTGSTKGKANYLYSVCENYIERSGVVGSGIPVATGAALSMQWGIANRHQQ